jgi:DNA polymerase-4
LTQNQKMIFHIDMDAFFASVEEVLHPEYRGKPLIVGGMPNERGIVACPNYAARALGVRTAMPLVRAARLAPHARFVHGTHGAYSEFSKKVFAALDTFSPIVRPAGLDEAYLDARGCLHFWGGSAETMGRAMKQKIREATGLAASVGIASNTLCAKVASDHNKPDGLCFVPEGEEAAFLGPMAIDKIPGIGVRTGEALRALGIETVHDLANVGEPLLRRVFGVAGTFMHEAAHGRGHGLREEAEEHEAKSISRDCTFREDTDDPAELQAALFRSCAKVARTLRANNVSARTVSVKLRYSDFATNQRSTTVGIPLDTEFGLYGEAVQLFTQLWTRRTRIRLVGVSVMNLRPAWNQFDLFNAQRAKEMMLGQALDTIRGKCGKTMLWFGVENRTVNI